MHLIMLAAGAGARMNSDVPKPFLDVNGEQMWLHVARKIGLQQRPDIGKTLVVQEAHRKWFDMSDADVSEYVSDTIDDVKYITDMSGKGPAWSVAAATLMDPYETLPILILDSDCWLEVPKNPPPYTVNYGLLSNLSQLEQMLILRPYWQTECILFGVRVFEDTQHEAEIIPHPTDLTGRMHSIKEGGVRKDGLLNVGAYWFRSLADFRWRLAACKKEGEVKISDVVNMQTRNIEVITLNGNFINIGTEELLKKYLEDQNEPS